MAQPTLEEKLAKIRSPNLQSQQQTAVVLQAVESTIAEQNTQPSATAYFAALLALLSQSAAREDGTLDLPTSVVYLLDVVTPFIPQSLLRAKFTQILTLLAPVLLHENAEAPLLRPSIGCLESLLLAQDSAAWELSTAQISPRRAVAGLLKLSVDPRPKVRKRALDALRAVLDSPPPAPSLDHPAAGMCAETAMASLKDLAEKAAQSRRDKRSGDAPRDASLIHVLHLVKSIAASSGGWPSKKIEPLCELLLGIARTGNEHLTVAVFEVFEMIFAGMADEISSPKLTRLLDIIAELRPAQNDTQLLPPWIAVLSRGYDVYGQVEPEDTFCKLPELFEMLSQFLESPSDNIRVSASECLVSFMANCVPRRLLLDLSIFDEKVLSKLVKIVETFFGIQYQAAWRETFHVVGAMFDALRWRADPFLLELLKTIGEMRGSETFAGKKEADEVIGKAIRAVGPEAVLGVLPLNLATPARGQPGRAWLLPLLRDYTTNTKLAHFKSEFLPLSNVIYQRVLDHGDADKTMEVKIYETIVQQIWSILPGYCDLPLDLKESFDQGFAELLANLLYQQVELRLDLCRALRTLVESNQAVASIGEDEDLVLQNRVSKDAARQNLEHLGTYAGKYLAVLFNVYGQTLPQSRGPILQTINAYLSITPKPDLMTTFDEVCKMLAAALQESGSATQGESAGTKPQQQTPSTKHTLMDLVITMSLHLPRESYSALFQIASLTLPMDTDPQLQKKAYKLIPRLAESPAGKSALVERHSELQEMLLATAEKVSAPARRERLAALAAFLPLLPMDSLHFIPSILSEVVICCKEQNERARTAAFELLVIMGQKMASADGALINNSKVPNMPSDAPAVAANIEEYFTMVSAGLAGGTPHMISASITAISRILYEFRESLDVQVVSDLVQTVDLFLTSNNREIVRSVLGFVKVCIISLPTDMMQARLPVLIPNLMIWGHEHKGHFRAKIKHILERMVRRFGFDIVFKHCPEADRKLITNIRKTKERSKRRRAAHDEASDDEEDGENDSRPQKGGAGRFESAYDEALYSENSSSDEGDSDHQATSRTKAHRRKEGNAYIMEDDDEPLDLLDRKALAHISSTRPVKLRKPGKAKAKTDADGKLILGQTGSAEEAMDVDGAEGGDMSGVGAYVAALGGKDAPKRGLRGKLKWSNKKDQGSDDEEMGEDGPPGPKSGSKRPDRASHVPHRGRGASGRGRGGMSGRSGKGGISAGRRGLGEERRRGASFGGRVAKTHNKRR